MAVFKTFCERLPATVELAIGSLIVSSVIAIPLGIFSAANNGTWKDNISMGFAIAKSADGISRQPEAESKIRTALMLGLVFIETAIIYALIVAILIIFVL